MGGMLRFPECAVSAKAPARAGDARLELSGPAIQHLWQQHPPAAVMSKTVVSESAAMGKPRVRTVFWLKTAQAIALAVAVCFSLGASDAGARFTDLGHRLMCTCSCAQLLGECNHVGCPESGRMRDELSAAIAGGSTDKQILDTFATKYGATVLAAPTTEGFNLVAWIAPFAVFAAALLGTILLVRHWSVGKAQLATEPASPEMDALRDRIRRETGEEGGY
jgi:cytochrome c-type biogenesis protein CcmH/NrfF